jgi:hypothetical protein
LEKQIHSDTLVAGVGSPLLKKVFGKDGAKNSGQKEIESRYANPFPLPASIELET